MYLLYFLLVIGLCCVMMSSSVTKQMKEHVSLWFLMELYEKHDLEDWVPYHCNLGFVTCLLLR